MVMRDCDDALYKLMSWYDKSVAHQHIKSVDRKVVGHSDLVGDAGGDMVTY